MTTEIPGENDFGTRRRYAIFPTMSNPTKTPAPREKKNFKPVVETSFPVNDEIASVDANQLSPEEQMALYEKDLKENDWGHQPC